MLKKSSISYVFRVGGNRRYLLFNLANIGFIWSGTYIFYSWDVVEPIAYFISSIATIVLARQFLKLKKSFTY
jgi:hypothetical protein